MHKSPDDAALLFLIITHYNIANFVQILGVLFEY